MLCFSDYSYWKWDPKLGKRGQRVEANANDYYWIDYNLTGCDYAIYRLFEKNCAILVKDAIETIMPERYEKAKPAFPIIMPSQLKSLVENL